MSENLYRLVYYSHNRIQGGAQKLAGEIRTILAKSQSNNANAGVTGALMFNRGGFAQVLEGPRAKVEETFERIQRDERHGEVTVLQFKETDARGFPAWSMGFVGERASDRDIYGDIADESGFDPASLSGDRLYGILHRLMLEEERSAA